MREAALLELALVNYAMSAVVTHGFTPVAHISSRHIPPTRHRLSATARIEEQRVNDAMARLEAAFGDVAIGPWFEATFSRS